MVSTLMIKLYCVNVNSMTKEEIDSLSSTRKEKASRYMFEKDKKLSLAAGVAFARGLKEYGLKESKVKISYSDHGKPHLIDYPDIHFNLSHSGEMAIAVFSDNEVGCDIEKIRHPNMKVIDFSFSDQEKAIINDCNDPNKEFTKIWTFKEAYSKMVGIGLSSNLKEINSVEITRRKICDFSYNYLENYLICICECKASSNH